MYIEEGLAGGLVNAQDPAMLDSGQLTQAINALYLPDDPTINRMPGRQRKQLKSGTGANISSMVNCKFDNGRHYLVNQTDGKWLICTIEDFKDLGGTAGYSILLAATTGTGPLSATQYNNRWYLSNGTDGPYCLLQDGTIRKAGLLPALINPSVATGAGSFGTTVTGYFEYWYTEMMSTTASADGGSLRTPFELESAFSGDPQTVYITAANTQTAIIKLPANTANPNTTHFRVYRGGSKVFRDDKVFPVGIRTGKDIPLGATDTAADGTLHLLSAPIAIDGVGSGVATSYCTGTSPGAQIAYLSGALANMVGSGAGTWASATASAHVGGGATAAYVDCGFTWADIKDPIGGISVTVVMRYDAHGGANTVSEAAVKCKFVDASGGGAVWETGLPGGQAIPGSSFVARTTSTGGEAIVLGGKGTYWGATASKLKSADFTPTTKLRIQLTGASNNQNDLGYGTHIDTVLVTIWCSGNSTTDIPFNAVILEAEAANNTAVSVAAAAPPVPFTTSTIFEGMLVTNDTARPRHLVYSQGGFPEYVPSAYYTKLEVPDHNSVTFLAVVNNRLVAGCDGALVRINYLPTEADTDFSRARERVWEYISDSRGIVNAKAGATFIDPETGQQLLAFISTHGLFATDGYTVKKLSRNIDWTVLFPNTAGIYTNAIALVHDPSTSTLWIYTPTAAYVYHYVTNQWTGPNYMHNMASAILFNVVTAAICIRQSSGRYVHLIGYGNGSAGAGEVWQTDSYDYVDEVAGAFASGALPIPHYLYNKLEVRSRDLYLAKMGMEALIHNVGVYGQGPDYGTPPQGTLLVTYLYANAAPVSKSYPLQVVNSQLMLVPLENANSDGIRITYNAADSGRYGVAKFLFNVGSTGETTLRA